MATTVTSQIQGITISEALKAPCATVATTNITLSGYQTISGVTITSASRNKRVLVKGQTNPVENGIYDMDSSTWQRSKDFDGNRDVVSGTRVLVRSASINGVEYELTTADPIVIGSTALTFTLRYGANVTYDQTESEIAAVVTPSNYSIEPYHLYRYGTNTTPGTTDMSAALQNAINACPDGGTVYLPPDLISIGTTTITCTKSITIQGMGGREDFDNSWNNAGGSRIWSKKLNGHALSFTTPNAINSRVKLRLRDFIVRGPRVSPGSASSGVTILIDGRQLSGTAIHPDVENVYVAEARDEGWYITGAVYGGNFRNIGAADCGKNGLRLLGQADPIGELVFSTVRLFDNGSLGGSDDEKAGLRAVPGATSNVFQGLSCTNNTGPGAILQSGNFQGSGWQFESNAGTSQLYIGSAGGGAGVTGCVVQGLAFSPGTGYTGNIINVTSDANNVKLYGVAFNDTLSGGGKDMLIAGGNCSVYGITTGHTFTYTTTADAYIEGFAPAFSANVGSDATNVTGDSTAYTVVFGTEIFDVGSGFNSATGVFTAPSTGKYQFAFSLTLGDIAAGHVRGSISVVTSNRTYSMRIAPMQVANDATLATWTGVFLADMEVGDTASLVVQVDSSTKVVDVKSGGYSWFSGRWVSA